MALNKLYNHLNVHTNKATNNKQVTKGDNAQMASVEVKSGPTYVKQCIEPVLFSCFRGRSN